MFDPHESARHVLIVDDEAVPRSLESFALEGTGRYYTVEASNATDALTALSGEGFDCAVIDLAMPDMSGTELISMIRRSLRHGTMPIVLILPEGANPGAAELATTGASQILVKPFQPWDLARTLDALVGPVAKTDHILSVESVLEGFPFPTMVLDDEHHVIIANGSFYTATDTGIGECYVYCNEQMHTGGLIPAECPLSEAVKTGHTAEKTIATVLGSMRVTVYPLAITTSDNKRLYLHVTQPIAC